MPALKPETYWNYSIQTDGGKGDGQLNGCSLAGGQATLSKALANAFRDAAYYMAMGYVVEAGPFEEHCSACCGDGQILRRTARTCRHIRCKACRGKGTFGHVPAYRPLLGESTRLVDPAAA